MKLLMMGIAAFWFCVGVAMVAIFMGAESADPPPGAIYVFFGAGTAFVGTVLTTAVPWGIRELWRYKNRTRITVLPPQPRSPTREQ
jgi:hypothetical protein